MSIQQGEIAQLDKVRAIVAGLDEKYEIKSMTRLGGQTNLVYRVETDKTELCVRIPGAGTEAYINRRHESVAAREGARIGVSAPVIMFNEHNGENVTQFLTGIITMTPDNFKNRPGAASRAGHVLSKLHNSDAVFENRFDVFQLIDEYLAILSKTKVSVPEGYYEVLASAEKARTALNSHPVDVVACHCDPLCENFLDTGEKMWLVDWEYSGMNDPMWDLGDVSVEAQLTPELEMEMVWAYFGRPPTVVEYGRIVIYKALCDLVWTLWGLIQHANNNPAEDFWEYSKIRFGRCSKLMASSEYETAIAAVSRG